MTTVTFLLNGVEMTAKLDISTAAPNGPRIIAALVDLGIHGAEIQYLGGDFPKFRVKYDTANKQHDKLMLAPHNLNIDRLEDYFLSEIGERVYCIKIQTA